MNRYDFPLPRVAFGAGAVAMTALTLAVAVVMPATLATGSQAARIVTAAEVAAPVDAGRLRLEVVGTRAPRTAFERVRHGSANPAHQG